MQSRTDPQPHFGDHESAPFFPVVFKMGEDTEFEVDVSTETTIYGLKEDYEDLFGIRPEDQEWSYQSTIMDDNLCLKDYPFSSNAYKMVIYVERKV